MDIDTSFLTDSTFLSMKESIGRYRTKHFLKILEDGYVFVPILRKMIKDAKIPEAFLYLAMAESNFSARAYSKAKAAGLWQFMPYTARKFGLEINLYVDERRDPIKSTEAAIKYLKYLHKIFGKWYLAAIAYNCGEGKLSRAIKKAKSDDLKTLLDRRKRYIPKESRLYIRKIVLMALMSNDTEFITQNGADYLLNRGSTFSLSKVEVKGGTTLDEVAQSIKISAKELKTYNPHLRYFFLPPSPKKYHLYLPYDKLTEFKQNFKPSKKSRKFFVHKVKKGDSLYSIGRRYGVNYKIIKDFNSLRSNILRINQKLIIPTITKMQKKYIIKKGDTLSLISKKFKVDLKKLMQANNLKTHIIRPGVKIVIPN